jgi:hypothetical protein
MVTVRPDTLDEVGIASPSQPSVAGPATRRLKNSGKLLLRRVFETAQRFGFDVLPRHFYSEIPDIRQLRQDVTWRAPFSMEGISCGLDQQLDFVRQTVSSYRGYLAGLQIHKTAVRMNGSDEGYGEIEADFLYCFVRHHRPKTIIQVGCGVSTAVCLLAARDEQFTPRIMCIDPYPTEFLQDSHKSGAIELVREKVQNVDSSYFGQLAGNDMFFVDSTHTLGPCGEVTRIVSGILPKLAAGTFVHFHDIWFPYDYCPHVLSSDLFFLHETPLLYAFLCMNERYSIAASLSQLFHGRLTELKQCFPGMAPAEFSDGLMIRPGHHPSSIYLRA